VEATLDRLEALLPEAAAADAQTARL
jgi:hypothetical protein